MQLALGPNKNFNVFTQQAHFAYNWKNNVH